MVSASKANQRRRSSILRHGCRLLLLVTILTPSAWLHAAPTNGSADDLEDRVWSADERELPNLHAEVVRLLQTHPSSALGHYLLSHLQIRQFAKDPSDLQLLRQASDLAQQAVDLDPKNEYGFIALADILDLMGYTAKATALLDEAESSGIRSSWRMNFTRARLVTDQKQGDRVLSLLEKALNAPGARPAIIVPYIVAVLQNDAAGNELIDALAKWQEKAPNQHFMQALAIAYSDAGKFQKSVEIYEDIIRKYPANREARINVAINYYKHLNKSRLATEHLEDVLRETDAKTLKNDPQLESTIRVHLAAAYLNINQSELAKANFLRSLQVAPDSAPILDFAANAYKSRKLTAGLVALLQHASQEIPGTGLTYALLGETLSESIKDHESALKAFRSAITLEPSRSEYYNGMGLAYYRMKQIKEALNLFSAATQVDPNDATARYNEACALALLGRSNEAVQALQEAIALDPRLQTTAMNDGDFAAIRQSKEFHAVINRSNHLLAPTEREAQNDETITIPAH